ncbi:hypothetical protein IFR04_002627 [Cadophora malorum]|uniref:Uncharacterized protein n=1 Tax=Cadophora malorum TaxID=108018 RepID=A0A8H8BUL2_9HELO|nr:hypothetical protein IFR04_002627 [Cadophora malorum]
MGNIKMNETVSDAVRHSPSEVQCRKVHARLQDLNSDLLRPRKYRRMLETQRVQRWPKSATNMLQEICERDELRSTYRPIKTEEEAIEDVADHVVWYSVHGKMMKELAFEKGKELTAPNFSHGPRYGIVETSSSSQKKVTFVGKCGSDILLTSHVGWAIAHDSADPIDAIVNAGMKNGQRTVFDIRESPPFPMKCKSEAKKDVALIALACSKHCEDVARAKVKVNEYQAPPPVVEPPRTRMRGPKKKKSVVENAVPLKQTLSAPEGKQLTFRQINSLISTRPATEFCSRKLGVACQKGRKETIGEMILCHRPGRKLAIPKQRKK